MQLNMDKCPPPELLIRGDKNLYSDNINSSVLPRKKLKVFQQASPKKSYPDLSNEKIIIFKSART
jgi:hypothetical protein